MAIKKIETLKRIKHSAPFIEHKGKVVESTKEFTHVMAIALDPRMNYKEGVIRCITNRKGEITTKGYSDQSELHFITKGQSENFKIGKKLTIKNETEIIEHLQKNDLKFVGLEDPDIWIDKKTNLLHLYFSLPFIDKNDENKWIIHLGHAVGRDLSSLIMNPPALLGDAQHRAKELSVAPLNKEGLRLNLIESNKIEKGELYSVIRLAAARDMGSSWEFGDILFHPKDHHVAWISIDASPGPLLPKSFIDPGAGKVVGIMNGREANKKIGNEIRYGKFSIGLFIYDYEYGKIDWVSPEPLIFDSEAKVITFASQFVETSKGEGILYAHVDDSFIRAYTLNAKAVRLLLPN